MKKLNKSLLEEFFHVGYYSYICAFNQPSKPLLLFDKYYEDMIEDFKETDNAQDRLLSIIKDIVNSHGWSMNSLGLQEPCVYIKDQAKQQISNSEDVQTMIRSLNSDQNEAFNVIVKHIDKKGNLLYLDGPAGTGKTYLYNVLCSYLKSKNKSTIQLATTGIAADLLQEGRTMHSVMKLPVPLTESSITRSAVSNLFRPMAPFLLQNFAWPHKVIKQGLHF